MTCIWWPMLYPTGVPLQHNYREVLSMEPTYLIRPSGTGVSTMDSMPNDRCVWHPWMPGNGTWQPFQWARQHVGWTLQSLSVLFTVESRISLYHNMLHSWDQFKHCVYVHSPFWLCATYQVWGMCLELDTGQESQLWLMLSLVPSHVRAVRMIEDNQ